MAKKPGTSSRPLPGTPSEWLEEILAAWKDACWTKPFGLFAGTIITDSNLFHLAPLVCLKFRGRPQEGPEADRIREAALANYVANTDPDRDTATDLLANPKLAFALCYLTAHLALDLVDEGTVGEVLEFCEERLVD